MECTVTINTVKIDFAKEYLSNRCEVTIEGIKYYGNFVENNDYDNPTNMYIAT